MALFSGKSQPHSGTIGPLRCSNSSWGTHSYLSKGADAICAEPSDLGFPEFDLELDNTTPCFPRNCFHCGKEILVTLWHQTFFPQGTPADKCPECQQWISNMDVDEFLRRFPPDAPDSEEEDDWDDERGLMFA